jgi:flagellin-like protein
MKTKWSMRKDEEGVTPVIAIILMVAITVVLAGVLYVWVTSLADTSDTVTTLQLDGELKVSSPAAASLELTHRGGDKVTWSDYRVTVNGTAYTPAQTETAVGEVATFAITTVATTALDVGEPYTVRVIEVASSTIVWEDTLNAKIAS